MSKIAIGNVAKPRLKGRTPRGHLSPVFPGNSHMVWNFERVIAKIAGQGKRCSSRIQFRRNFQRTFRDDLIERPIINPLVINSFNGPNVLPKVTGVSLESGCSRNCQAGPVPVRQTGRPTFGSPASRFENPRICGFASEI